MKCTKNKSITYGKLALSNEKVKNNLLDEAVDGVCISTKSEGLGIYKSFNYEIFERRPSIVIALDGNSPVLNLIQEAKNGKAKAKIYINNHNKSLRRKARILQGYVTPFELKDEIWNTILDDNEEIRRKNDTTKMEQK